MFNVGKGFARNTPIRFALAATPVLLFAASVTADETRSEPKSDPSTSLEIVLQKASEQGFVDLQIEPLNGDPDHIDVPNPAPENKPDKPPLNCGLVYLYDFNNYTSVSSYEDIAETKSKTTSFDTLDGRLPLIKTYWSLGLGTEAVALSQPIKDIRSPLVTAISRTISGDIDPSGIALLEEFRHCNAHTNLWLKAAYASTNSMPLPSSEAEIDEKTDLELLNGLPPKLREVLTLRLGVLEAEMGDINVARDMFAALNPEMEEGALPTMRDDASLYLFARLDMHNGGEKGKKIIEHLGQYDGPMRAKALTTLSQKNLKNGDNLYDGFSEDLKSVRHQFNGKSESRQAAVQAIYLNLKHGGLIESVAIAKHELDALAPQRLAVVDLIASEVAAGLKSHDHIPQLDALNAYLYDPSYYLPYSELPSLKYAALESAINLNMPELEADIINDEDENHLDGNQLQTLNFARLGAAQKSGDLTAVKKLAKTQNQDPRSQKILIEALVEAGENEAAMDAIANLPVGKERLSRQANLEWQSGDFMASTSTLRALDYAGGDEQTKEKLALSEFISLGGQTYSNILIPNTSAELDELEAEFSKDIETVKAYLNDG